MTVAEVTAPRRGKLARARQLPVTTAIAGLVLLLAVFFAVFNELGPHDPGAINAADSLVGPGRQYLLGTDQLGRDVFSRILAGARTSLSGPMLLATGVTVVGSAIAILAGYFGGLLDATVSRIVDFVYSIPSLMIAIIVAGVTGGGFFVTVAVLIVFNLPMAIRNLRAAVLERVTLPYMEAARTLGVPTWRILVTHLLPAITPFIVATFFLSFTYGIVELSSLSFLGIGVPPGATDWGRMVADNRASMYGNVWATAGPAISIVVLAVSANLIGEWLYARYEAAGTAR